MRHHIEQLLTLEERLTNDVAHTFQRDIDAHVPTAIQLPIFKHVSIVRQVLAQCAHIHIGLYEHTPKEAVAASIAALRHYLHRTTFDIVQLDALCYFEQWYTTADERHLVRGQARDELKIAIAYIMTWIEQPVQLQALLPYLAPLCAQFNVHFPHYSFEENVKVALDELVDVEQIATVSIDVMQTERYTLEAQQFQSLKARLAQSTEPYRLLTHTLRQQLQLL